MYNNAYKVKLENLYDVLNRAHCNRWALFYLLLIILEGQVADMTRKESRELSFILLFEQAVTGEKISEIIESAKESRDIEANSFVVKHVKGAEEHGADIDEAIRQNLKGWSLPRLSKTAVSILRLAVWELMFDKTVPVSVTINEAVELAKTYGGKDDAPYVNGVLSGIFKSGSYVCKKDHE